MPDPENHPLDQCKDEPNARLLESSLSGWRFFVPLALIVAAGLLTYHNSFKGPFVFDGTRSIVENPSIRRLWPIWEVASAAPGETTAGRPVLSLSLALNYQISGLDVWSYHLANLTIHILAGLVLFAIVRRTLLSKALQDSFSQASWSLALVCALIWLVHPLQTSSVTYVVQRAESLMALFYLLSLYSAMRGFSSNKNLSRSIGSRWWYVGAITACALGVATKEVAATAPILILLYDRVFVSRSFKQIFAKRRGLYAGLACTWLLFGALAWTAPRGESVGFAAQSLTTWMYLLTQSKVIVLYYLKLAFWPHGLVLDYGWPISTSIWNVWYYAMLILALLAGTVVAIYKRPSLGFLGVWFFVILGPSSSVIPILTEVAAEHRMYLPLAAIIIMVVLGCYTFARRLLARLPSSAPGRSMPTVLIGYSLAGLIIILLSLLSIRRNHDYHSRFSIWNDTLTKRDTNWRAHSSRGVAYAEMGDYDLAFYDFEQAIKLNSKYPQAYYNRGIVYHSRGEYELAIRDFDQAITLRPTYAKAYYNRGVVYGTRGQHLRAIDDFNEAITLNPKYAQAYYNRALAYRNTRDYTAAISDFIQAIQFSPANAEIYNDRGVVYAAQGDYGRAIDDFTQAITLNPNYGQAYYNRALAYQNKGDNERATRDLNKARQLNPKRDRPKLFGRRFR